MKKGLIYCIKNKINGQKYIGKTVNAKKRIEQHFSDLKNNRHYNTHLQNSFNKYGKNNFKVEIVEENIKNKLLNKREKHWIKFYRTFEGEGYNMTNGGDGAVSGKKHPLYGKHLLKETKEKISKATLGIPTSKEVKNKISKSHIGLKHSRKTKEKISKATNGKNNGFYGKQHLNKSKKKMKKAKRNNSLISYEDVFDIIKYYFEEHLTQREIAIKYNVCQNTISRIIILNHWASKDLKS